MATNEYWQPTLADTRALSSSIGPAPTILMEVTFYGGYYGEDDKKSSHKNCVYLFFFLFISRSQTFTWISHIKVETIFM